MAVVLCQVLVRFFTAELHGILSALKEILTIDGNSFVIFSDSRSVLQALESFNPVHPLILEILEWLFLIQRRGRNICFCWVPAHVGIQGNEKADKLAKEAAVFKTPASCALPYGDFVPVIKSVVENVWQFYWDLEGPNKMREIAHSVRPWTYYPMTRRRETALCRLRIGHTRLTHGYLMSRDPPPFCPDCLVPNSVKHLLVECPSLEEVRRKFLIDCRSGEGDYVLERIIGRDFNEANLFDFILEIGILYEL